MKEAYKQFDQNEIDRKIRSRLSTQDRTSGNKVWLLMRTVKRLLNSNNPEWFVVWSKGIINQTKVLIDQNGTYITLNKVDCLLLKPSEEKRDEFDVFAVEGVKEFPVYTHKKSNTGETIIVRMTVDGIENVSLDHVKPIDTTLRELENQNKLLELGKISKVAKIVSRDINSCSGYRIDKNLDASNPITYGNYSVHVDLDKLRQEMEEIKNDTDYELMDGRLNSSKGNDKNETNHVSPVKKTASKTTLISKKPATSTKNTGVIGIGQYAKALFTRLVQQGKLTKSQIAALKDPNYCKATFGIGSFAVLVDAKTTYDKSRYYKHDSQIPFVICNNWHKQNWEKLEDWMKQNIKNDLFNKG